MMSRVKDTLQTGRIYFSTVHLTKAQIYKVLVKLKKKETHKKMVRRLQESDKELALHEVKLGLIPAP